MQDVAVETVNFIDLNITSIIFLFIVGFIGGLVSGFIGSGGRLCAHSRHDEPGCAGHRGGGQQHVP